MHVVHVDAPSHGLRAKSLNPKIFEEVSLQCIHRPIIGIRAEPSK